MKTKMKYVIALVLCAISYAVATERAKHSYKVSYISRSVVGIACTENANPTVITKSGDVLLISCGQP